MNIFDDVSIARPASMGEEKFLLSRKNGKLSLKVKSPLFENLFRDQAKGEVTGVDPLWGVPLYKVNIDPGVDAELSLWGVSFRMLDRVWADRGNPARAPRPRAQNPLRAAVAQAEPEMPQIDYYGGPNIQFNISFLLARGLENGMVFPLKDQIPLSLIEGPEFIYVNTLKKGLFHVMKQFLMDYEATIIIQSDVKI